QAVEEPIPARGDAGGEEAEDHDPTPDHRAPRPCRRSGGLAFLGLAHGRPRPAPGAQPAGPPVEAIEEVARAIAVTALADDLVEQRPGLLVLAGGEGRLGLLQPRGEHALRLDGGGARLLQAASRLRIVGIEEKDA